MTKAELISKVVDNSGVSKKDAECVLKSIVDAVTEELQKRGEVALVGFGTFKTSERAAREGKNPATGEKIKISAKTVPTFKPSKALKDLVSSNR